MVELLRWPAVHSRGVRGACGAQDGRRGRADDPGRDRRRHQRRHDWSRLPRPASIALSPDRGTAPMAGRGGCGTTRQAGAASLHLEPMNVEQVKSDEAMGLAIEHLPGQGHDLSKTPSGGRHCGSQRSIVGAGGNEPAGGDHTEVVALRRAGLAKPAPSAVTMNFCNHYGKIRCVNALIEARRGTVVYAVADPNGIAGVARRLSQRAYRCGPGCWLNRPTAAGVAPQATHRSAACHLEVRHQHDGRSAAADPASGSPAKPPHVWICTPPRIADVRSGRHRHRPRRDRPD